MGLSYAALKASFKQHRRITSLDRETGRNIALTESDVGKDVVVEHCWQYEARNMTSQAQELGWSRVLCGRCERRMKWKKLQEGRRSQRGDCRGVDWLGHRWMEGCGSDGYGYCREGKSLPDLR